MRTFRLSVIRFDVIIIGLALALLAAAVVAQILFDRRSTVERGVARAESDARLISEHATVVFRTADRIIQGTIETIGDRSLDDVAARGEFREILRQFASDLVNGGSVSILDRDGRLVLTTSEAIKPGLNFADRAYFQELAGGAPRYIGRIAEGRVTAAPIVLIGRPLGSGESFRGIVTVGMPAHFFTDFYSSVVVGRAASVALMGTDGNRLVHEPRMVHAPRANTTTLPPDIDRAVEIGPSAIDGRERIAVLLRVPEQPLIVSTAIGLDSLLRPWRRRSIALGGLAVIAIGLLAGLAFVALRSGHRERAALQETRNLSNELAIALAREQVMRREHLHRTKNNLAMMIAMLQVESRRARVDRDAFLGTANRISALALAQESLDHATEGDIDCAEYLGNIAAVLANAEPHGRVRLELSLEPVTLPAARAQALGLITNELITNSIKHAFRDRPYGTVRLNLRTVGGDVLFDYRDDGPGVGGETRAGSQGLRLIETLCRTLQARHTASTAAGMHFHLSFAREEPNDAEPVPTLDSDEGRELMPGRARFRSRGAPV